MLTAKFDPQPFFQQTNNIALHVPAGEVFSLLTRSIDLPAQWGALVGRSSGDHVAVAAGGAVEADDAEQVLFVRLAPVQLSLRSGTVSSRDEFSFDGNVRFRVRVLPDRADLAGFLQTVVGSRRVIQNETLAAYFDPPIRGALAKFLAERDANELAGASACHLAGEAAVEAMQVPLFAAGMTLDGAVAVTLESTSFRSVQKSRESAAVRNAQHESNRQLNEALRHAREEHLDRLAESLARLREMAAASPGAELPQLIRTFSEHQRGQLYEALFATREAGGQTKWIVAVCSDELLYFDAQAAAQPSRRMRIDGAAGPARSVQPDGDGALLIGAARGVYVWPVDAVQPGQTLTAQTNENPRGGFNAVVCAGDRVVASHSELGIREWNVQSGREIGSPMAELTRGAKAVRNLAQIDGDFYCSIDDVVIRWRTDATAPDAIYRGASSQLTAIAPTPEGLFAGTSSGDLLYWPAESMNPDILQRGMNRAIESIHVQAHHGVRRLIYSDTSPRVHARVIGDSFTFHYEAGGQTLRRVEAAGDLIVAMNELRDRLILWTPAHPGEPQGIIQVGAICGRNVQDFCLLPAASA